MSSRSATYHPHGHPSAMPSQQRQAAYVDEPAVHHSPRRSKLADYTIGHGARQVRVGPVAFWTIVGTLVIMGAWSIITATYFAFQDDVLTRLISRQTEMQYAYEDRIAEMRAQVDRVTSRQLLDQEQFERKLDALLRRQSALESRAALIGSVADPTVTGSVKTPPRTSSEQPQLLKPSPISSQAPAAVAPLDRRAGNVPRDLEATVARLQTSLDRLETRQTNAINAIEDSYEGKVRRLRSVFADLGVDVGKRKIDGAVGGPFVPFRLAANPTAFERQVHRVSLARAQADRLSRTLATLPVRQPMEDIDTSSGFGVRIDPFVGRPAMHTGLDFRGDIGDPVRATAAGEVTAAGWNGGYGKQVEIDHGNGLSTRYAHMSEIDVKVGQHVKVGQIVGKLGSTGRSTGPHLHYETRVDGDAVDPQKFLRAGTKLAM
jgi:murein DD-endopeptidase MepM/ murein hydrolase activator NlpD